MWIAEVLKRYNRRAVIITFSPHLFDREAERHLDLDYVETVARTGKVVLEKSEAPRKICFEQYFGKEKRTYTVIVLLHEDFWEVRTCWTTRGRR
jgi:hypothetical protein